MVGVAYEVLLMRLFSIAHWHHFAYMIISVALLGFGASGTFVAIFQAPLLRRYSTAYLVNGGAFAAAALISVILAGRLPFNTLEILWDQTQWAWLCGVYVLLACPFFFLANLFALSLSRYPAAIGRVYGFDLVGAGLGAAVVLLMLYIIPPGGALRALTVVATLAWGVAVVEVAVSYRRLWLSVAGSAALMVLLLPAAFMELGMTPYKALPQALLIPGTRVLNEWSSPMGLVTVVESAKVPFRHAPGMSLSSAARIPDQLGVFIDGDGPGVITRYRGEASEIAYLDALTSALPYHLLDRPRVLVVGAHGDAILQSIGSGAAAVDAVELDPIRARLLDQHYADFYGWPLVRDRVQLHTEELRAWLQRNRTPYDLIVFPLAESSAAAGAGVHGLMEDYLFTREAFALYIEALSERGMIAVSRWVKLPPRDEIKLIDTAVEVLAEHGFTRPDEHIVLLRGWKTTTLVMARHPLSAQQIGNARAFADARSFDVVHVPGVTPQETNRFNQLQRPYYAEAVAAMFSSERLEFKASYPFAVSAASDDRPYFFQFFRWASLGKVLELREVGGLSFLEWGYPILVMTLLQAGIASIVLIVAPLLISAKRRREIGRLGGWVVGYFSLLGFAFMFLEMALIQRFTLFLHHPVHAAATVIAALLIFAGLGSRSAQTLMVSIDPGRVIGWAGLGIAALIGCYLVALPLLFDVALGWDLPIKFGVAVLGLAPLGFVLGMPFPMGLALLAERNAMAMPWAWCVNGCASVMGAVLGVLLAVHWGFTVVVGLAAMGYLMVAGLGHILSAASRAPSA